MAAKAMAPKPQQASVRNSRRLRVIRKCSDIVPLVHVQERIEVEQDQREFPFGLCREEGERLPHFLHSGRAARSQPVAEIDLLTNVRAGFGFQTASQSIGLLV